MELLGHIIIAVLGGYGMAVALVEKGTTWPIRKYNILLGRFLFRINPKAATVLECTVCTSFWTTLIVELILMVGSLIDGNRPIFSWPVSGFITLGLTWTVMDILRSLGYIADNAVVKNEN